MNDFSKAMQSMTKPIVDLINDGQSFDEILASSIELFPNLNTDEIEEIIAKGILISNAGGRLSI